MNKLNAAESNKSIEEIFEELLNKNLIKLENVLTVGAKRLDRAITLNNCNIQGADESRYAVNSYYYYSLKDAFLGIEKFSGFVDESV